MVKTSSLVGLGLFAGVGGIIWVSNQSGSESTESAQSGGRGGSALTPQALRDIARSGRTDVTFEAPETNFPDVGSDASDGTDSSKKEQRVQTTSSDSIGDFATAPDAQSDAINEASNESDMSVDPVLRDDSGDAIGTRVAGVVDDPAVGDSGTSKKMSRLPDDDGGDTDDEAQQESESRILSLSESRGGDDSESDESDSESKKMSRVEEGWL